MRDRYINSKFKTAEEEWEISRKREEDVLAAKVESRYQYGSTTRWNEFYYCGFEDLSANDN